MGYWGRLGGFIMAVSRKQITEYMQGMLGAREVVLVDEFETLLARHICNGGEKIQLLQRCRMPIELPDGVSCLNAEYYFCQMCGKLIIDKNSITLT